MFSNISWKKVLSWSRRMPISHIINTLPLYQISKSWCWLNLLNQEDASLTPTTGDGITISLQLRVSNIWSKNLESLLMLRSYQTLIPRREELWPLQLVEKRRVRGMKKKAKAKLPRENEPRRVEDPPPQTSIKLDKEHHVVSQNCSYQIWSIKWSPIYQFGDPTFFTECQQIWRSDECVERSSVSHHPFFVWFKIW